MQGPMILNRYQPIEMKGEGGSGKVEICWDTRIQRRVAIKRMPILHEQAGGVIPGLAEARTGAMLSRPSIVSVYDFDIEGDEALLIMEAIEGPTLAQINHDTPAGSFDLDIAAAIVSSIGDAIDFAHENQVLHLDIKPENILVNHTGAPKISDFGISELADAQGFRKASGGTIGYMPPEQMDGLDLDERTDEFALAAVVYEILTGLQPFSARTLDASVKKIENFDGPAPSSLRSDLDPGIDKVLFKALSADPDDRYDTVADFLDALFPYLGNPVHGGHRLREIVQVNDDEEVVEAPEKERVGVFERVSPKLNLVLGRIIAALLCWWLSVSALIMMPMLTLETSMLVALLPAVAAIVKPPFGALLALLINGVSLFIGMQFAPILGSVVIALAIVWVIFFGFESTADTNCALLVSPLSFVGFAPFAPMLAAFCLPPKRALAATVIQVIILLSGGVNAGPELIGGDFTSLATWIMVIAWLLSAFLMSAFCVRGTRVLSIVGTVIAGIILIVAQSIGFSVLSGTFAGPSGTWAITIVLSCITMCVIAVFGTSKHDKGEL